MSSFAENVDAQSLTRELDQLAKQVDSSCDRSDVDGLRDALTSINACLVTNPDSSAAALLHYFAANAWSGIRRSTRTRNSNTWEWQQPELEKEVLCLRSSMQNAGFASLPDVRRCQVATNLGNALSTIGRFIEAIEYWNRALQIDPFFAMALGNRGEAFFYFARVLYDDHHRHILLRQAVLDLRNAVQLGIDARPGEHFRQLESIISERLGEEYITQGDDLNSLALGKSAVERDYRRWCLQNTLFLNPLNDVGDFSLAARDIFSSPSVTVRNRQGPSHHGFYNQMKQEYVSARFLYFEGISAQKPHFSDREVLLHDTMDNPAYCLAVEKIKLAFRIAYSLFDKVSFFINDYFELGIPERSVNFRSIWYDKQCESKGLRSEFERFDNWPMRGLYWVSKDLHFKQGDAAEAIEPDAHALRVIRNHAEHKYLKLHGLWSPEIGQANGDLGLKDSLAFSISRTDFAAKSLRMLKIARAALMYLSLGIHWEERRRRREQLGKTLVIPLTLNAVRDQDKL